MMDDRGFIYPFTVIVSLFFTFLVLYHVDAYLTEKQLIYEEERLFVLQSLLQAAVHEFEKKAAADALDNPISFSYDEGTVTIVEENNVDGISDMFVQAMLHTGHRRQARFVYNWKEHIILKYREVSYRDTSFIFNRFYGGRQDDSWQNVS